MKLLFTLFLLFISLNLYSQSQAKLQFNINGTEFQVASQKFSNQDYFNIFTFSDSAGLDYKLMADEGKAIILFPSCTVTITNNNSFLLIESLPEKRQYIKQLSVRTIFLNDSVYLPLEAVEKINSCLKQKVSFQFLTTHIPDFNLKQDTTLISVKYVEKLSFSEDDENAVIKIEVNKPFESFNNFYSDGFLYLILWNVKISNDTTLFPESTALIKKVEVKGEEKFTEIKIELSSDNTISRILKTENSDEILLAVNERELSDWYEQETEHFKIIYRDSHSHLVNHILASAENSLNVLTKIFDYEPSEKIIINTYDVNDYGFAATTTLPHNYIRLEIEPLEPGYEVVPYNDRIQWLISHELVHVVVNDKAGNFENGLRSVLGKVNPEKNHALTIPFSYMTSFNRYTPRWHQEGLAVFLETWLSGGFGRVLGNFDEMYFRSFILDEEEFPSIVELDGVTSHKNILLENLFYIFGGRFASYLAIKYGTDKLFNWYDTDPSSFYNGFKGKFKDVFGKDLIDEWYEFYEYEKEFQLNNIALLKSSQVTELNYITSKPVGWVTTPYKENDNSVIFGYHKPEHLATAQRLNLIKGTSKDIISLPAPSIIQISSTAYDPDKRNFFYTTNNNQLYRDLWLYDVEKDKTRLLFHDSRVGHLSIAKETSTLWGIRHSAGAAVLVKSEFPYTTLEFLYLFDLGDEVQQIAVNSTGEMIAATVHRTSGEQSIILFDVTKLSEGGSFNPIVITSSGSPENPSWSADDKYIYWNAYRNGVSNIYRIDLDDGEIVPLTHTLKGLFRPLEISKDLLFAFEYSIEGFLPVTFEINKAEYLPAIHYLGQQVINNDPNLFNLRLNPAELSVNFDEFSDEENYNGFGEIDIQTFIPVITGFQNRKVLGVFTHISDPLLHHDFVIETGISPFQEMGPETKFHLKFKYLFKQKLSLAANYNAPNFYDLFNDRKKSFLGSMYTLGYTHYWLFDNPQKIKQNTELTLYSGVKFINDNLTEVTQPDFLIFKSEFDNKNLRRTIGSIDYEVGDHYRFTVMGFASNPDYPQYSGAIFGEWSHYTLFAFPHNVLHFKTGAGYHYKNEDLLEAQFFFGGFGNRYVEDEPVKQFEKIFRFPGVPIYSIVTDRFFKVMIENSFPPIRFDNVSIGNHYLKNINLAIYSQALVTGSFQSNKWIDVGTQINFVFSHWFNLESTISTGIARAWYDGGEDWDWFLSLKLFKD